MLHAAVAGGVAVTLSCVPALDASAAVAKPAGTVRGLDVSAYQHVGKPIAWREIARQGIRFVSVKASEGTYYRNPYYDADAKAAKAAGLIVLPYVFANPAGAGGGPTARYAVGVTGKHGPSGAPLVVDLENDPYKKKDCYGVSRANTVNWIGGFIRTARALTRRWPIIYTTAAWWSECTGGTARFGHDPLWLAAFGPSKPTVPPPWHRWAFWQYSDSGRLAGIGPVDLDYYQPTSGLPTLRPPAHHRAKPKAKPTGKGKAKPTAKRKTKPTAKPHAKKKTHR